MEFYTCFYSKNFYECYTIYHVAQFGFQLAIEHLGNVTFYTRLIISNPWVWGRQGGNVSCMHDAHIACHTANEFCTISAT